MDNLKLGYGLDDIPPFWEMILQGLQWLAVIIPIAIIVGKIVADLHFDASGARIVYMQKIFFITGVAFLLQLLWGHRLPLIIGPATILLVGIVSSRGSGIDAIYTAMAIGGLLLFVLSATGLFAYLKKLFTPSVVATILILVAFTLTPMILDLSTAASVPELVPLHLCFVILFVISIFVVNRIATGFWKSALIMWAMIAGTIIYYLVFPQDPALITGGHHAFIGEFFHDMILTPKFEPGVIISFLVCFIALSINDLGSIYSLGGLLEPDNMPKRVTRGLMATGALNTLAGFLGVIGPVNFSLSPGVILSSRCGSRFTLIPPAAALLVISFLPSAIAFLGRIPSAVVGGIMIYIMCSQIAAGMSMVIADEDKFKFENGLAIALPLMLSIIVSYLPQSVLNAFSPIARPIVGNGFVVGVVAVLIMEHLVFRDWGGCKQGKGEER
ncbi:MAG: purine/pyrimidine permease [Firmicutes bacterium]|jgi:xanthine/uracil permease|nr:purine/pyrimidine permease [Bacillota bacterium]